ncbi:MAG: outer membrane beta-barrel protein [Gammaproteobacteria bacterium]
MRPYTVVLLCLFPSALSAENFAGGVVGISTLSADATTQDSPPSAVSAYKPENGLTAVFFIGRSFTDWFSLQASYGWTRNSVVLSATQAGGAFAVPVRSTMHTIAAEAMVHFRRRGDRVRPYLSAGPAVTILNAKLDGAPSIRGALPVPPPEFDATKPGLRVAVGIDLRIRSRLFLRYSFSETIQSNTLSRHLTPRGSRNLANFQNLWGVVGTF